jgi:hypothetical protein
MALLRRQVSKGHRSGGDLLPERLQCQETATQRQVSRAQAVVRVVSCDKMCAGGGAAA